MDLIYPNLFTNPNIKFLDPYAKSGLYIAEITKRLYKGLQDQIPDSEERIRWILENQVYAIAPSNIIYNIVKNFVYPENIDVSTKNLVELDLAAALDEEDWQQRITQAFGGEELKFDVIIGNPPYQEMDGGGMGTSAMPLYHHFVDHAKKLNPKLLSFIIPARWYSGGKGLHAFRDEMLNDKRIRELHDFFDATDCFPDIDISGGVCYFLWDRDYDGDCRVVTYRSGVKNELTRPLRTKGSDVFIRFNEAVSIFHKVQSSNFESFANKVSARRPFGIDSSVEVEETGGPGFVKIYAYPRNGYVSIDHVIRGHDWLPKYKVLLSKAYGERGAFPYLVTAKPFIGEPNSCCSETYLVVHASDSRQECENVISYMTTRFFRFLVLLKKNTQNTSRNVYSFVPVVDFSEPWTDDKLYSKYALTDEEIEFIESMVRPMVLE